MSCKSVIFKPCFEKIGHIVQGLKYTHTHTQRERHPRAWRGRGIVISSLTLVISGGKIG